MDLKNLSSKENWTVKITDYKDFLKIVKAYIIYMNENITEKNVDKRILEAGGEGIIRAAFNENKKNFANGKYVFSVASSVAGNYE